MTMMVFLNELSEPRDSLDVHQGKALMDALVRVLKAVKDRRPDTVLHSAVPLNTMALGDGYSVGQWFNDPESRDSWRWLRGLQNRAPFQVGLGDIGCDIGTLEYLFDGDTAEGLGLSHLFGGLAVSFAQGETWQHPTLSLARKSMLEDETGEAVLEEVTIDTFHASLAEHVTFHADWLKLVHLAPMSNGEDLWLRRADRFPHLDFLPRTEAQCRKLLAGHPWFKEVVARMRELEEAVAEWDPSTMPQPRWRSHVTSEGKTRRRLCRFTDLDGIERVFDLHARFTPGCGRLHFRLDASNSRAVIAHVGEKIT